MPIGYIQPLANPYVGIDVDYFDKKALEKQQRHDTSRALWSEMAQTIAGQEYQDANARQEYLKQQKQLFDNVINTHSGNLSEGYQDVLGAIETAKTNPYHNLNKRHVEQSKIQQELAVKYGPKFIDQSKGLKEPIYTTDEKGNITWKNPNEIQAGGIQADDYWKVFEDVSADFKARSHEIESELQRTNNPYYLEYVKTGNKALLTEAMVNEYVKKYGADAFMGASNTWAIDNRDIMLPKEDGTNKWTLKDADGNIIANKPQLEKDLASFIMDRVTDNPYLSRQAVVNQGAVLATRARHARQQAIQNYQLEQLRRQSLGTINPVGQAVENNETYNTRLNRLKQNKDLLSSGKNDINSIRKEFKDLTGIDVNDLNYYVGKDGKSVNINFLKTRLKEVNPNMNDTELNNLVNKLAPEVASLTRKFNETNAQINDLEGIVKDDEQVHNKLVTDIYGKYYTDLNHSNKQALKDAGIDSPEKFAEYVKNHEDDVIKVLGTNYQTGTYIPGLEGKSVGDMTPEEKKKLASFAGMPNIIGAAIGYKEKQLAQGVNSGPMIYGAFNTDPNSMEQQYPALMKQMVDQQGLQSFMSGLATEHGENYLANHPELKDFMAKASKKNDQGVPIITYEFIMPANSSTNNSPVIKLTNKDTGQTQIITDAVVKDDLGLYDEIANRKIQQELLLSANDPGYDMKSLDAAYEMGGSKYGSEINYKLNQLKGLNPGAERYVDFTSSDGSNNRITVKKLNNGYQIGNDPTNVYSTIADVKGKVKQTIGYTNYWKNPNLGQTLQFYPEGGDKLKNVDFDVKKSKIGEVPDYNENAEDLEPNY